MKFYCLLHHYASNFISHPYVSLLTQEGPEFFEVRRVFVNTVNSFRTRPTIACARKQLWIFSRDQRCIFKYRCIINENDDFSAILKNIDYLERGDLARSRETQLQSSSQDSPQEFNAPRLRFRRRSSQNTLYYDFVKVENDS